MTDCPKNSECDKWLTLMQRIVACECELADLNGQLAEHLHLDAHTTEPNESYRTPTPHPAWAPSPQQLTVSYTQRGNLPVTADDISNAASFGVEWVNPYSGNTYQVVNKRGTTELAYRCRGSGQRLWATTTINDRSPMAIDSAPTCYEEFFNVAQTFIQH